MTMLVIVMLLINPLIALVEVTFVVPLQKPFNTRNS